MLNKIRVENKLRKFRLECFLLIAILIIGIITATALADQEYPTRPVELIGSYSPGGFTDLSGRIIASVADQYLGQPMVMMSKSGGSGAVGLQYVIEGGPTGYRLIWDIGTLCVDAPLTMKNYPYTMDDIEIIAAMIQTGRLLAVSADAPWENLNELFEYSRENPGKIKYGSSGTGGIGHLAPAQIADVGGVEWVHIPYEGTAAAVAALVGGHIDLVSAQMPEIAPMVDAGKVRLLLTTHKVEQYPDVPTLEDLGYDTPWYAMQYYAAAVPKGTPEPIVQKLRSVFEQISKDKSFLNLINKLGVPVVYVPGDEIAKIYIEIREAKRPLVEKLGLTPK